MAYQLTPLGKTVAFKLPNALDAESAVLVYMYEHTEPIEVEELVGELNSTEAKMLKVLNRLINLESPYVKEC